MKGFFSIAFCSFMVFIKSQVPVKDHMSIFKVKYNFTALKDTLDASSSISEPMILLTNGQTSIYYSENFKAFRDGFKKQMQDAIKKGAIVEPGKLPRAKVRHSVYKENGNVYITNHLGRYSYTFKVEEPIVWKIINSETKNILGYQCSKAISKIGNRNYIAWFTYDIPIDDGPYKFKGLPGLILSVYDEKKYFDFELLSITKTSLPINPEKGITITKKQYLEKRIEYINDPFQGKINTPEYRKRIEENKKKFNNFLEN